MTKEKVKKAYQGKLKDDKDWKEQEGSINDDLETFLINLQNQKEVENEFVQSFFTPKLTNEELKLVQEGNEEHMKSYFAYFNGNNPDVDAEEMKESDSKSKYVHGDCWRITIPLRLETIENEDQTESEYETDTESEYETDTESEYETDTESENDVQDTKNRKTH